MLTYPFFIPKGINMTTRKVLGIVLIILGIAIFISLITLVTLHGYRLWSTNDSGKAEEFPTFIEYWLNFNKGTTVLSFVLGAIPVFIGFRIRKK